MRLSTPRRSLPRFEAREEPRRGLPGFVANPGRGAVSAQVGFEEFGERVVAVGPDPVEGGELADDPQSRALPAQDYDDVEDARDVRAEVGEGEVMHALAGEELDAEERVLG